MILLCEALKRPVGGNGELVTSDRVRDFIVTELRWEGPPSELTDDYPLLQTGVIDSLGLFRLVDRVAGVALHVALRFIVAVTGWPISRRRAPRPFTRSWSSTFRATSRG